MVDPVVLTPLPWPLPRHPDVADGLLARWSQPHRRYHDVRHLAECLAAAQLLGAGADELLALWFHDAVHSNTPGPDEAASARLARQLLAPLLPAARVDEVARLVLITERHQPAPDDVAGAIVSDADLWILGAEAQRYDESVRDLRAELDPGGDDWPTVRRRQIEARLSAPIYWTRAGGGREAAARANLVAESAGLDGWSAGDTRGRVSQKTGLPPVTPTTVPET